MCPWCGGTAKDTAGIAIVESRVCDCGAVVIAGPQVDSDEIIDAAIDHFRIKTRPESRGYDTLLLRDIEQSGVEIREGIVTQNAEAPGPWAATRHLWFRRTKPSP